MRYDIQSRDRRNGRAEPYYPYGVYGQVQQQNITINNVTVNSVTNVVNAVHVSGRKPRQYHSRYPHKKRVQQHERKPELLRFVGSCGVLDQDKAVRRLDNGTFGTGVCEVLGHTNRDLARTVKGIGHGMCQIGRAVGDMIGGVFGLVADILK